MDNPCYKCEKRDAWCHAGCAAYDKFFAERAEARRQKLLASNALHDTVRVSARRFQRVYKNKEENRS